MSSYSFHREKKKKDKIERQVEFLRGPCLLPQAQSAPHKETIFSFQAVKKKRKKKKQEKKKAPSLIISVATASILHPGRESQEGSVGSWIPASLQPPLLRQNTQKSVSMQNLQDLIIILHLIQSYRNPRTHPVHIWNISKTPTAFFVKRKRFRPMRRPRGLKWLNSSYINL